LDTVGYELCTPEGGKGGGVRATRGFEVGETVMVGELEGEVERNDSHATQISRTKWARHGGLGPIVNHSCDPNCGVEVNASGACDFIARESILAGEEITFDYAMRNYSIEHFPGGCLCGADKCRGSVTGWKDLSIGRKVDYAGSVAPYLLEIDRELAATLRSPQQQKHHEDEREDDEADDPRSGIGPEHRVVAGLVTHRVG